MFVTTNCLHCRIPSHLPRRDLSTEISAGFSSSSRCSRLGSRNSSAAASGLARIASLAMSSLLVLPPCN